MENNTSMRHDWNDLNATQDKHRGQYKLLDCSWRLLENLTYSILQHKHIAIGYIFLLLTHLTLEELKIVIYDKTSIK